MDISVVLARFFALYLLVVLVSVLVNRQKLFNDSLALTHNAPLMLLAAIFTVLLGALLVAVHNLWVWDWRVVVTVFAWVTFLKGAWYLIFPKHAAQTTQKLQTQTYFYGVVPFVIAMTLFFAYYGFI